MHTMSKSNHSTAQRNAKTKSLLDVAAGVFAQYGYKRTTMNDVARAGGISRPALYLMFDNKEHLFRELAAHRITLALEGTRTVLKKINP